MILEHSTHPDLLSDTVSIALAGAGGTGSQMLTGLARLDCAIRALGHPGLRVSVFDPDTVSTANLGRQGFAPAEVGSPKACALVTRVNAWFGLSWAAIVDRYTAAQHGHLRPEIVITCIDSAAGRMQIGGAVDGTRGGRSYTTPLYWLDVGNRAADGQVVLGIPPRDAEHAAYPYRLPTALELYPELTRPATAAALDRDTGPSCSLAQALERQELFINQAVATPALQLLWNLLRRGRTSWCAAFINAENGRVTPLPIDPEAWARFGVKRPAPDTRKETA